MANFDLNGNGISNQVIQLSTGKKLDVGVWGPINIFAVPHREIDVVSSEPIVEIKKSTKPITNNIRLWEITGKTLGTTTIKADAGGGQTWDTFTIKVVSATSKVGVAAFPDIDKCGITALDEVLDDSISQNIEFTGAIFNQSGRFGFTRPTRGEPTAAAPNMVVPAGAKIVGLYHTHANAQGNAAEGFSFADRGIHNLNHLIGYLGTPSRAIRKFIPKDRDPNEHPALAALGGKVVTLRGQP